jgi:hypothetical protein
MESGSVMKEFEFRYLDSNGKVIEVERFQYLSSYSAMISAEKRGTQTRIEVWCEDRCVYSSDNSKAAIALKADDKL